jgi:hypothetical protein
MGNAGDDRFDDEETARRRDAALLRALSTPHKKQADLKLGKKGTSKSHAKASLKKRGKPAEGEWQR